MAGISGMGRASNLAPTVPEANLPQGVNVPLNIPPALLPNQPEVPIALSPNAPPNTDFVNSDISQMQFDPLEAILAGDDPLDSILNAEDVAAEEDTSLASKVDSALTGIAKFGTLGYAPQLAGAIGSAAGTVGLADTLGFSDPNIGYTQARDEYAKDQDAQYDKNPNSYGAGAVAGSVVSGLAGGAVTAAKTAGQAIAQGAKAGALWGAIANPGDKEGEINPVQLSDRLINGGIGSLTGGLASGAFQAVGSQLSRLSETEAAKQVGKMFSKYYGKIKPDASEIQSITKNVAPEKSVIAQLEYAQRLNDQAKSSGITLQAHELFPQDPALQAAYKASLSSAEAKTAQLDRAAYINDFITGVKSNFNSGGKSASNAIEDVGGLLKRTGQDIGDMRAQIIKASEDPRTQLSLPKDNYSTQGDLFAFNNPTEAMGNIQGAVRGGGRAENANRSRIGMIPGQQTSQLNRASNLDIAANAAQGSFERGKTIRVGTNNLDSTLPDVRSSLGFVNNNDGSFVKPTPNQIKELATRLNVQPRQLMQLVDDVSKLSDELVNSGSRLTPRKLDGLRKQFQTLVDAHEPGATDAPNALFKLGIKLKDAARDDFDTAGNVVFQGDKEKMAAFLANRERYSFLKELPPGVEKLLEKGSQATDDMVAWFETGGFQKNEQVAAFMQAAKMTSPEAADAIAESYTRSFFNKFSQGVEGDRLRFGDLNEKAADFLGKPVNYSRLQTIVGKERAQSIKDLADSVKVIRQANPGSFQESAGTLKYLKALAPIARGDVDQAVAILQEAKSVRDILAKKPIEQWTSKMSPRDRENFLNVYNQAVARGASQTLTTDERE
jgi:hypothetical protein